MDNSFTFVTISYNQNEFILEHLKSIEYQIKKFGKGVQTHYILADDYSTDGTLNVVREWLDNNSALFSSVTILDSRKNVGTVENHIRALKEIKTHYFILLSGDDLLYKYDVFSEIKDDIVICPTVAFDDNRIEYYNNEILFELLACEDNQELIKKTLLKRLKIHVAPCAASLFFSYNAVNSGLFNALIGYKWIEDYPIFEYLFKSNFHFTIVNKPLVLYRNSVGISNNNNHSRRIEFKKEEERVFSEICRHYIPRYYFNPYHYAFGFSKRIKGLFKYRKNLKIKDILNDANSIFEQVNSFREEIRNNK